MSARHGARRADFFWPLALLAAVAIGLIGGTGLILARQFDLSSESRQESVVENGLLARSGEVAHGVVPVAQWDDAVRHIQNHFDVTWVRDNVGADLFHTNGFQHVVVLSGDDRALFAADFGAQVDPARAKSLILGARRLVERVRDAEARRGARPMSRQPGQLATDPVQATEFVRLGPDVELLTASLVEPDFGTVAPAPGAAPILLTARVIDRAFIDEFARRYMLRGATLTPALSDDLTTQVPLRDGAGHLVAALRWRPEAPGAALLRRLAIPLALLVGSFGIAALYFYRRTRSLAQGMIASEARATHMAYFDSLTGLPNRVLFFDRLGHALDQLRRSDETIAVHCIDLDRFKEVNDTFGHGVGDELIQEAARRLASQCRSSDTLARLSGDEFAVVQPRATAASVAAMAVRLIEAMGQPVVLGAGQVFAGCSVGVTLVSDGDIEAAEALRQADIALYRAKETARGGYCLFEPEMDAAIKMRRAVEVDLREALARGQLRMEYQPQYSNKGMMTGVEALVRWNHKDRGPISPSYFVPIAEECGLIAELGMFTLRRAFEDSHRWKNLTVAVNVSANQLRLRDFVAKVATLVDELVVDPRQFEFEITEGVLLGNDPATHDNLRSLRKMGFSIALDDFGTGYSSLSYLSRYPISKIKIDRSFVTNLSLDRDAEAVVAAIVRLAHALKLTVLAEGVETAEQFEKLSAAGCTDVQGYLFGRPVTAEEIDQTLSESPGRKARPRQRSARDDVDMTSAG